MNYKAVFLDMDGTLYQTENNVIQQANLDVLKKLHERGILICAATGRPLNQMKLILERVPFFDYMVLINGGYVLDKEQNLISERPLDADITNAIVAWSEDHQAGLMFHFGDATYIYNQFYPMYYFCRDHHVLDSLFYDEHKSYHRRHHAYNAVFMSDDQEGVNAFVAAHPQLRSDLIKVESDHLCFDIFNVDNDKTVGIEEVLKREHLKWEDCVCFGDSTNDTQMLKKAGCGIAMGNASDHVKSFADRVTASVYEEGVAKALKEIFHL